jgi:hypothetical protein
MIFHSTKLEQLSKQHPSAIREFEEYRSKRHQPTHKPLNFAGTSTIRELKLLFGVAFLKTTSHTLDKSRQYTSSTYHLTFIPPRWFSTLILQWKFRLRYENHGFPAVGISLSPIRYNSHPVLVKAVKSCDVMELQKLFRHGLARPNDYLLLRRRPMLLLEVTFCIAFEDTEDANIDQAIASRSANCNPDNVLETYKYLLDEGLGVDSAK